MAEIRDELVLDIDQALRDITRVEQALDRSLAPVELRIDVDDTAVQRVEDSLRDVRTVAEDTTDQVRLTADEYREVARAIETGVTPARAIAEATGQVKAQASLAEADFRDLARALDISEDQARDLTQEVLDSERAAERLKDAARDVARQLGLSDSQAERLAGSLREADRAADAIDVTTIGLANRFAALRTSAVLLGGALAGVGGTALLVGAIGGANAAIQSFARLEDSINAVNVVFDEASGSVLTFGENAAASAGLSQQAFNQAVVPIGSLLQNFGFDAGQAADAAVILVQRGADLASVYGGTVQDALLAVGAALRGEADPLERYGASISAARVETFALAEGLVQTKAEITPAIALQARYGLILADTARVSGDFANTSGDLANAQRSASGAVTNFVDTVGEQLAPALETILVLLPEVLEGVRQLVPGFAAAADSAAGFFESVGEGGGFRTEFSLLRVGFEAVTTGAGLAKEAGSIFSSVLRNDLSSAGKSVKQLAGLFAGGIAQGIAVNLANSLDKGTDSVEAFSTAVQQVALSTTDFETFTTSFREFSIAAGLSKEELYEVTLGLYNNRTQLNLTADEVDFLRSQLDLLNETLDTGSRRGYTDYNAAVDGLGASLPEAAARFVTFGGELATARTTITQTLQGIADDVAGQQDRLLDALDPFAELPEQINLSAAEATAALVAQFEAIAAFEANIIRLAADAPNLALELFQEGPSSADLVEDFLDTPALIEEAENALRGVATAGVNALTEELENDLVKAGLDPSTAAQFAALFTNPNVITEVTEAGIRAGATGAGGYVQGVLDEAAAREVDARTTLGQTVSAVFDQEEITDAAGESASASFLEGAVGFDPLGQLETILGGLGIEVDLSVSGSSALSSFLAGFVSQADARSGDFGKAVKDAVERGLVPGSPYKVMVAIGKFAAESFAIGFEQTELTVTPTIEIFDVAIPPIDFTDTGISAAQTFTQGFTEEVQRFDDGYNPGDFGFVQRFDDGYNPGDFGFVAPEAIQFDFDLQALQEQLADLAGVGTEGRDALMAGLSTASTEEITRLRASILDTVNEAIQAGSPSRLFLRIGGEAGDSFWSGFNQSELALKTPTAGITGSISNATAATNVVEGGFTFAPTVINPTVQDLETTLARQGQLFGAVSGALGRVGRALPK